MSAAQIERDLAGRLSAAGASEADRLGLLLRAGELESALEDLGHPAAARARQLSDAAAEAWRTGSASPLGECGRESWLAVLPEQLRLRRPEGYAYYALHPAAYARALERRHEHPDGVAIVGVRSIGTSLSALVLAELRARGVRAERITVRPSGHPWDRRLEASPSLADFVQRSARAHFLIVDEGPGLSGSTFLGVGEGLERYGIPAARIEFLTSHQPDLRQLVARGAAERWQRYLATAVPAPRLPEGAQDWSAGSWRAAVYASESDWPACHVGLERHKYRTREGRLIKFSGWPPYAEAPLGRGELLADAGFCPQITSHASGYVALEWIEGRPLSAPITQPRALGRLLDYLVARSQLCRAEAAPVAELERMLQLNVAEAIGWELPARLRLHVEQPVCADARLAPHEWIESADGTLFKVDATDHGDDHSFPGPCDSAWDIAGAIVEWRLGPLRARELCAEYQRRTRDRIEVRLAPYLLAYTALQLGRAQLASLSAAAAEQPRLACAQRFYLTALREFAATNGWQGSSCVS